MSVPAPQEDIWLAFLDEIKGTIPRESFFTWFGPMRLLKVSDNEVTVQIPSQFYYDWIEEHYPERIKQALEHTFGIGYGIKYSILENNAREFISLTSHKPVQVISNKSLSEYQLNPRYTFDNFIVGDGNSFARASAIAVAEAPGKTRFNPLVIYGGVGLGKTHLLQAIGNYSLKNKTSRKAIYISSEKFTNDFIRYIRDDKMTDFSKLYRSVDILMVDDVQFFEGKERTQMEFFHTFNTLYQAGKQVVLTMDRPPAELNQTEPRLISRFHCGLVTDIQPPDFETRIAILQKRAEEDRIIIDESILTFIAENIINNIRELEGALIRLAAHQSITGQSIDLNTTKRILRDILKSKPTKTSVETIQNAVADYYHIPADLIRGDCRKKEIATARQVAIYLCHTMTDLTLKSIGSHFGNRDHSTILYSLEIVKRRISVEADFREKVDEIKRNIESLYK